MVLRFKPLNWCLFAKVCRSFVRENIFFSSGFGRSLSEHCNVELIHFFYWPIVCSIYLGLHNLVSRTDLEPTWALDPRNAELSYFWIAVEAVDGAVLVALQALLGHPVCTLDEERGALGQLWVVRELLYQFHVTEQYFIALQALVLWAARESRWHLQHFLFGSVVGPLLAALTEWSHWIAHCINFVLQNQHLLLSL